MYGVSNVEGGGNYFPLSTSSDEIYTAVGVSNDILQTVKRFGFNIDTVPNAKTKLVIENVFEVLQGTLRACQYIMATPCL